MRFTGIKRGFIGSNSGALARHVCFTIVIAVLAVPAIYRSYGIFRADRIVRSEQTVDGYSRAIEYDPSNALLWWGRGRIRHYSLKNADIASAAADYEHALSLNPRISEAWADLSDCYEHLGRIAGAQDALQKALATRAYSPAMLWRVGNFYLRRGNLPKMYECFHLACQYDSGKLGAAMEVAWKMDPDHAGILGKLIPDDLSSNIRFLSFLVGKDELDLASPVWQRCLKNEIPPDFEFKPASAFAYIDRLLVHDRISEGQQVWGDAFHKAGIRPADTRPEAPTGETSESTRLNMIWNGSFEDEILRGGFDWRYPKLREVRFQSDTAYRMDGLRSLHVSFGDVNISSDLLSQIAPVTEPGSYRLDFYLRTTGLTTDQMPYITIRGYPDAAGASGRSDYFPSTTAWSKVSVPIVVKRGCKAVRVVLRRNKSSKFGNRIEGSLWLDGMALRSSGPKEMTIDN